MASKEAGDFLAERLAEQRKAVEASERALQEFKERNGAVSIADGTSSIAIQRLTDLNAALIKAKTERINKEALYNQLKSTQATGTIDTLPGGAGERLHPGAEDEPGRAAARSRRSAAERYGAIHPEMIKVRQRGPVGRGQAERRDQQGRRSRSTANTGRRWRRSRACRGRSTRSATKRSAADKMGIAYSVLQREADSNRQIYESLLQRDEGDGHLRRAARDQRPRRRSRGGAARPDLAERATRHDVRVRRRAGLRDRPRVRFRVSRQPHQDAAGAEGASRHAVPRDGADVSRTTKTGREPAAEQRRAAEFRRSVQVRPHQRAVLVGRRGHAHAGR